MDTKTKFRLIEAAFGSSTAAASAAGIDYATWYRWKKAEGTTERIEKTLSLLLQTDEVRKFRQAIADEGTQDGTL